MVVRVEKTMITQIAQLHIKSFKNYFFTKLGKKLIMKCYEYYVDNGDIFLCNLNSDKSIDGFLLFVFKESMARDKFIKKYKVLILIRYFLLALTGDIVVWKKALKIAKSAFMKTNKLVNPSLPYILSICVHENSRGKGVAPLMIDELEKKLINQGKIGRAHV